IAGKSRCAAVGFKDSRTTTNSFLISITATFYHESSGDGGGAWERAAASCRSAWPASSESASSMAEALRAVCDLDLSALESVEPPRGFGRDSPALTRIADKPKPNGGRIAPGLMHGA